MIEPSLVLIHGAWHVTEHFTPLIEELEKHGYKCVTVSLPGMSGEKFPAASFDDDTAAVRKAVQSELDLGNDIVVVAHSYGGVPANNALKGFNRKSRSDAGEKTAVVGLAFIAALLAPEGGVFWDDVLGGHLWPIHDQRNEDFVYVGEPGPEHYFYNDLSAEEAKKWAEMIVPQSFKSYTGKTTYVASKDIPSAYLHCTEDQAAPYPWQQLMVETALKEGAQIDLVETVESSHSPFLSMPQRTAEYIRRVAGEKGL